MNHTTMNKVKISDNYFHLARAVDTINNIDEDGLQVIHLAGETLGYIIKKIHTGSLFIMQLKFYLLCTAQIQFV